MAVNVFCLCAGFSMLKQVKTSWKTEVVKENVKEKKNKQNLKSSHILSLFQF